MDMQLKITEKGAEVDVVSVMDVRGNSVVNVSMIHMQYNTYCKVSMHAHSTRCYCMLMGVMVNTPNS